MTAPKIVAVVPTIRPESMRQFRTAWSHLFEKHGVTLVTVWDGEEPEIEHGDHLKYKAFEKNPWSIDPSHRDLFCRRTDAIRNVGFVAAAALGADFVLTLDDDCQPVPRDFTYPGGPVAGIPLSWYDPIQTHLDALSLRVPLSWMNTAHCGAEYLRGVPYGVRDEAPVMLSHGVWVGVPDFDGETQLRLGRCPTCLGLGRADSDNEWNLRLSCNRCNATGKNPCGVPRTLPYYVGPIPRGINAAICGMNVMVRKEALPYLYFAPMGPDSGVGPKYEFDCSNCRSRNFNIHYQGTGRCSGCGQDGIVRTVHSGLHRFGDIWMGRFLLEEFDNQRWAVYSGASTILHARASDAAKNCEQERLGRQWNEEHTLFGRATHIPSGHPAKRYFTEYEDKRRHFAGLIRSIQEGKT